jgi:ATP synthase protein I
MTTAPPTTKSGPAPAVVGRGVRVALVSGLVATVLVGGAAALVGALAVGSAAALGAVVGTALVCVFFGAGAVVVAAVARVAPAASLLIALLTYTLNVVLVALVFVALGRSGALGSDIDPQWLGGTVIGGTLVWLTAQVVASMRTRIPVYELPGHSPSGAGAEGPRAGAR